MVKRFKRGFTLVELLVVIAIIGILASVILVSLNNARQKARDSRRIADLHQLSLALENYYDDNIAYPSALASVAPTYIAVIPTDPQTGANYNYDTDGCSAARQEYVLRATLELGTNPALDNDVDGTACTVACDDISVPFYYCIQP